MSRVTVSVFCRIAEPSQLFDVGSVGALLSAPLTDVTEPRMNSVSAGNELFAAEKANHVLEAAHLIEMSAYGQTLSVTQL